MLKKKLWKRIPQYCVAQTTFSTISIRWNYFKLEGSEWKRHSALFTVSLWLWNGSIVLFVGPWLDSVRSLIFTIQGFKVICELPIWNKPLQMWQLMTVTLLVFISYFHTIKWGFISFNYDLIIKLPFGVNSCASCVDFWKQKIILNCKLIFLKTRCRLKLNTDPTWLETASASYYV